MEMFRRWWRMEPRQPLQDHGEVQLRNPAPQHAFVPRPMSIKSTLSSLWDDEDPPPYEEIQPIPSEAPFHLCEHMSVTMTQLRSLYSKYGPWLCRCSRYSYAKQGVMPPWIEVERSSNRAKAVSHFHLLYRPDGILLSLQDVQEALVTWDRPVCTHLKINDVHVFSSLARHLHLPTECFRRDLNRDGEHESRGRENILQTKSIELLRNAKGHCGELHCDTHFGLEWISDGRGIGFWVIRRLGAM